MINVLMVAFGNPDNVFSLCGNISHKINLTLLFVVSGNSFRQGVLDLNLEKVPNGLISDEKSVSDILGSEICGYISGRFRVLILKTGTRKFIHKRTGPGNFSAIVNACTSLNKENFDIVHYNGTSGFMLYFLMQLKTRNRFWTLHDYKSHTGEENRTGDIFNRIASKYMFRYIQHYEYLGSQFAEHFGTDKNKVHCVYSGPFDVYNVYDNNEKCIGEKYILFFGRISAYKGLDTLLSAFSELNKDVKIKLVVAGAGEINKNKLLNERIEYINEYIPSFKLVSLIKNAEFVVAPYTDSTHSGVIMTAYNFRKPVIAANIDGIDEVVQDNRTGLLFRTGDSGDLKNKIETLLGNRNMLEEFSGNIDKLITGGFL